MGTLPFPSRCSNNFSFSPTADSARPPFLHRFVKLKSAFPLSLNNNNNNNNSTHLLCSNQNSIHSFLDLKKVSTAFSWRLYDDTTLTRECKLPLRIIENSKIFPSYFLRKNRILRIFTGEEETQIHFLPTYFQIKERKVDRKDAFSL